MPAFQGDLSALRIFLLATALLVLALGLAIARVAPRRRGILALAAFAVAFGLSRALRNLDEMLAQPPPVPPGYFQIPLETAAVLLLPVVAASVPRPLAAAERRLLALAGATVAATFATIMALGEASPVPLAPGYFGPDPGLAHLLRGTERLAASVPAGVLVLLALRFRARATAAPGDLAQLAFMSASLMLWFAGVLGPILLGTLRLPAAPPAQTVATVVVFAGTVLLPAALWLANASRAPGPQARLARNVALVAVGSPAGALGLTLLAGDDVIGGVLRLAMVLLVAYAILRRQLLGLDVRVKWTVRQSTVAAAFIGVFFVVSESASSFLATEGGLGTYLGIGAAGLLVFAIAPLQRSAERVASAAMPGVKAPEDLAASERTDTYRELARAAWADGALSADERRLLDKARERLRLPLAEAHRLEAEVMPR